MCWPYHDLRPDRNVTTRARVEAVPPYPGQEADEKMLVEIAANADLQPQD